MIKRRNDDESRKIYVIIMQKRLWTTQVLNIKWNIFKWNQGAKKTTAKSTISNVVQYS